MENVVVPNGIDLSKFRPQREAVKLAVRKKLGLKPSDKMILVAGRLSREKNVDVVIRAYAGFARENPGSKLVVCGTGPALGENIALARKLGVGKRAVFTGFVPNNVLPAYYSAADAFVTASTFETQGLTVLEAMACGTLVLGANALAIPDEVKNGKNGFLFEPNARLRTRWRRRLITRAGRNYGKYAATLLHPPGSTRLKTLLENY